MKYFVLKCNVDSEDFTEESYGMMIVNDDGNREYICNISKNYEDIIRLVGELNNYPIESCHINSIVEDFKYRVSTIEQK